MKRIYYYLAVICFRYQKELPEGECKMGPKQWNFEDMPGVPSYYREQQVSFKGADFNKLKLWYKPAVCLLLFLLVWGAQQVDYPGAEGVRRFTVYVYTTHEDLTPYLKKIGEKLILGDPVQPAASPRIQETPLQKPITTMRLIYPVAEGRVIGYSQPQSQYAMSVQCRPGQLVRATQAGRVAAVTGDRITGYSVQIDHGNGFASILGSLAEVWVKPDDQVQSSQTIGKLTSEGNNALLTFKLTYQGQPIDPLDYINGKRP